MRPLIALVLSLVLAACGSSQVSPSASDLSGVHAAGLQAPYLVTLTLPKATWSTNKPITGAATLALAQGPGVDLRRLGRRAHLLRVRLGGWGASRRRGDDRRLPGLPARARRPDARSAVALGGFYPEQPDFEFNRAFLTAPDSPAGRRLEDLAIASLRGRAGPPRRDRTIGDVYPLPL